MVVERQPRFPLGIAGSRYFCGSFYGHPCPTSGKNYATANAFGGPSRPASLVAYPTRGMQHSYRNDSTRFRKACIFTTLCSVKTHALSLLGTTRLLSRSAGKTHLATAMGVAAIHKSKRVRFYNAVDLVNELEREKQAGKTGGMARKLIPVSYTHLTLPTKRIV